MESSKVGYWLQVGANIGILVGLIMVGFQINQAGYLLRNQLVSDQYSDRMSAMESMLGENPADTLAKAFISPGELSDAELIVMDSWMMREVVYARRVKQLVDSGVYPPNSWEQHRMVIDYAFASKFGRTWWALSRNQYLQSDPDLVVVADSVIESLPDGDDWNDFLGKLRKALQ